MISLLFALIFPLQDPQAVDVPVTLQEYLRLKDLSAVQVSPDGGAVAFTVRRADLEASEYRSELYVWRPDSDARTVTRERTDARMPRWSPDGAWLAFLSNGESADSAADKKPQVWLLPIIAGGEAIQLTKLGGGVLDFGWAPGVSIYALARASRPALLDAIEERQKREKDDPVVVRDEAQYAREFWRIGVPDGSAEYVWGGDRGIREMAVSPDGRSVAFSTNGSGSIGDYTKYDLWVLDVEWRRVRRLTDRAGSEVAPVWSPDSRTLVFQAPQNPELSYSQTELFSVPARGGPLRNLTDAFDRTVLAHRWPPAGDLLFTAALVAYTHIFAVRDGGAVERLTAGAYNYGAFDAAALGTTVYAVRESATEAAELWRIRSSEVDRLTELNARAARWKLGRQEMVRWPAPDGLSIEGLLVYPADYESGRRYPLLVNPHGGPSSRVRDVLDQSQFYQLFAAQGYAVLAPNFRGSIGYGESFGTANRQDLGGGDFIDLMAGVDHAIEMGVADSTRLAIYGGSYGGYMTNWAITQTTRFAAAVSMYGIFNLITDYSNSNIPRWEYEYLRAYYWEDLEEYLQRSPMRFVARVQTPVLIVHGADDPNTFISNSNEMYRALKDLGRVVEYVKYPREGHGIREPRHRADLFFRQLRWFDKYLKFGGADLFEFYMIDEWVPGPGGWQLRVVSAEPHAEYAGTKPESGRYLEVVFALRPDTAAVNAGTVGALELDLGNAVRLVGPDDAARPAAGTVTDIFGQRSLITGSPGTISVPVPQRGAPTALAVALAFEIPAGAAEYRLRVGEFAPVRLWAPANPLE